LNRFFDIQVNGYAGVDFMQQNLTDEALHTACERLEQDGVSGILATVITDTIEVMAGRLRNLARARVGSPLATRIVYGIHIEGPFLSPIDGFRGAHPRDAIRPANWEEMEILLDACDGLARLVTLAPEHDPGLTVTKRLAANGIRVSAGHCNPSLDELKAGIDAGVSMFTHLGNGCPMLMHRHDNIIQRALSLSDQLWICLIADGVHVPFPALSNYIRAAGVDRCIVVTDAIAPAGLGPGRYTMSRWDLLIGEDMVARAPDGSHFVGSAITMQRAAQNLTNELKLSQAQVERLTYHNPTAALGDPSTLLARSSGVH
jgi:N-acetylglucosamine-6-phosphate deacetylase